MATNQPYIDAEGHFQHPGYMNNDVTIDPRLNPMPDNMTAAMMPNMADRQMMNAPFWNPNMGNQMAFFGDGVPNAAGGIDRVDGADAVDGDDQTNLTGAIASSSTTPQTFSESSNHTPRTRSMTSSRSSVPSANSASSDQIPKSRKGKQQQSARQRKQSTVSVSSRRSSQQLDTEEDAGEDGSKRNRFLERNRIAASKCRQKKKEWVHDLEESKEELENQNNNLHLEHNALIAELTRIKNVLMEHATCQDPNIDQWLENEARRFVQNTANKFNTMGAPEAPFRVPSSKKRESYAIQPSPPMSTGSHTTPAKHEDDEINFDHMPDAMFDDEIAT